MYFGNTVVQTSFSTVMDVFCALFTIKRKQIVIRNRCFLLAKRLLATLNWHNIMYFVNKMADTCNILLPSYFSPWRYQVSAFHTPTSVVFYICTSLINERHCTPAEPVAQGGTLISANVGGVKSNTLVFK